jgi:6-phosphofructokinase 1
MRFYPQQAMKGSMKKILILTSGGDAPGMNPAIRAAVRSAIHQGVQVYASHYGYQGLIDQKIERLYYSSVANCIQLGGTILKTDRCLAFYEKEQRRRCLDFLDSEGIEGLIVIGGDGSFRGASTLQSEGGPAVIGIPATIDNDISGTEYTIGFDTARNTALEAIDRVRDTASSHNRDFLVEVMGRNAGFLAVDVGLAGGAEFILTPEFNLPISELASKVNDTQRKKLSSIIVVAESDQPGRSLQIAKELNQLTNKTYRVCILGHMQRGGTPSALDRKIATLMGAYAVNALIDGSNNQMITRNFGRLSLANFPNPEKPSRRFDNQELLDINSLISR